MRISWTISIGFLGFLGALGCQNPVADQRDALYRENQDLRNQLADDQAKLAAAPDPNEVAQLKSDIAAKDQQIAQLQAAPPPVAANTAATAEPPPDALAGMDTHYDPHAGTLTVTLADDVLFDPGKAALIPRSAQALDKVVSALSGQYADKELSVDGYTDTDPIKRSSDLWFDNRDLSYARAKAVTQYLTAHGISGGRIVIRAFGENHPRSTKAKSRRVEIVVMLRS